MSSQPKFLRVGEKVSFPKLKWGKDGSHQLVNVSWQVQAIFPVSQLVVLAEAESNNLCQVSWEQLCNYN